VLLEYAAKDKAVSDMLFNTEVEYRH